MTHLIRESLSLSLSHPLRLCFKFMTINPDPKIHKTQYKSCIQNPQMKKKTTWKRRIKIISILWLPHYLSRAENALNKYSTSAHKFLFFYLLAMACAFVAWQHEYIVNNNKKV